MHVSDRYFFFYNNLIDLVPLVSSIEGLVISTSDIIAESLAEELK